MVVLGKLLDHSPWYLHNGHCYVVVLQNTYIKFKNLHYLYSDLQSHFLLQTFDSLGIRQGPIDSPESMHMQVTCNTYAADVYVQMREFVGAVVVQAEKLLVLFDWGTCTIMFCDII